MQMVRVVVENIDERSNEAGSAFGTSPCFVACMDTCTGHTFKVAMLIYHIVHRHYLASSYVAPTCHIDIASVPHLLNSSMFRSFVGLWLEVVPFLLLQWKCGTVYLLMSHPPRRYQFSRTDWKLTYSATAMTFSDISYTWPSCSSPQCSGPRNSFNCLGHSKNLMTDWLISHCK